MEVVNVASTKIEIGTAIATHKTKEFVETIKRHFIGSYTEAPGFLQDNEFIKHGYRIEHKTCC